MTNTEIKFTTYTIKALIKTRAEELFELEEWPTLSVEVTNSEKARLKQIYVRGAISGAFTALELTLKAMSRGEKSNDRGD